MKNKQERKELKLILLPPKERKEVSKEELVSNLAKFINLIEFAQ